jgi:hypothetical protein
MKPIRVLLLNGLAVLFFTGCGTAIDNLGVFQQDPIERAELMPSQKALKGEKLKVVVMSVEDKNFRLARSANLGEALTKMIETEIGRDRAVDILDRSISNRFEEELKLNELNELNGVDTEENMLLASADYAVVGELKNANFNSRFVKRSVWVDKKGNKYVTPSHYIYSAVVNGQIKIFELPSMKLKKIISFSDTESRSEDSRYLGSRIPVDHGLLNAAGANAIRSARIELKNFLAPKGYLIGARSYDGDRIVKISLGSNNGLQEGDRIEIRTHKTVINQLSEEESVESYRVAFATVSDKIQERTSWAILDEVLEGEKIRLGDEVKVIYSKGFFDYVQDARSLIQ